MPDNAPSRADRYTCIACPVSDLPAKLRASSLLGLQYFVKEDVPGHCFLFLFFDKAGLENYLAGYYAEAKTTQTSTSSCSSHDPRPRPATRPATQPTDGIGCKSE